MDRFKQTRRRQVHSKQLSAYAILGATLVTSIMNSRFTALFLYTPLCFLS